MRMRTGSLFTVRIASKGTIRGNLILNTDFDRIIHILGYKKNLLKAAHHQYQVFFAWDPNIPILKAKDLLVLSVDYLIHFPSCKPFNFADMPPPPDKTIHIEILRALTTLLKEIVNGTITLQKYENYYKLGARLINDYTKDSDSTTPREHIAKMALGHSLDLVPGVKIECADLRLCISKVQNHPTRYIDYLPLFTGAVRVLFGDEPDIDNQYWLEDTDSNSDLNSNISEIIRIDTDSDSDSDIDLIIEIDLDKD